MEKGNLLESEQRNKLFELKSRFDLARISENEKRAEEIRQIFNEATELGLFELLIDKLQEEGFGYNETF